MTTNNIAAIPVLQRFWLYQQERFPVVGHGVLIAAFSFSTVAYSALLRGAGLPGPGAILVGFISAFLFFLQLRLADEFKDQVEDARYRPYRPVPRGLVSLGELAWLGGLAALLQVGLAVWLNPGLIWLLLLVWGYLALMSREFFARAWLKARPFTYMWSHMLIMPLIDFYTTACDWQPAGTGPPPGLLWLLVVSFCNGMVIELGRKIRAPQDEEPGVETYTALWGRPRAVLAWLAALLLTAIGAWRAAAGLGLAGPVAGLLLVLLGLATLVAYRFLSRPASRRARWIETMSGLWTVLMYLSVGVLPLLVQLL